uniref:NADH dehydrogenase subunit 6 n=1 Tax=Saldula arsenjevi TaxID=498931 RepID=B7SMP1_9HEMI|nr:NADH dehydrogenase subunit 6 [Saldula arsenjevi]ABZ02135.1 NADH dehydrogenase subunit 6 [Saldula arsenjevi]
MLMLMFMTFLMTMLFLFTKHPLSMGIVLITQTIMISMLTGVINKSFWFSYMLVMILLSGALVLFIYMASIASNEKFYSSVFLFKVTTMLTLVSTIMYIKMDSVMKYLSMESTTYMFVENEQMMNLMKLFNLQNMQLTFMMVMYLLFTMIVVVYNINIYEGPMRAKN